MLGRPIDMERLGELPEGVNPCGENGEFHTFVCNGPGFARPLEVVGGHRVLTHERYLVLDLQPA